MSGPAPAPAARLAVREVALAQARTLSRAGRHAEAEELLDGEEGAAVLDLRARIHAQQGRLDEADRCWTEVAAISPGDLGAAGGRRRIAAIRAKAASPRRFLLARSVLRLGTAAVVLLASVMLADVWLDRNDTGSEPGAVPSTPAPSPVPSARPSADPLAELTLEGPGVRVDRRGTEIEVTFDRGLFRRDAALTSRGRATLEDLGERLRPYADRIAVAVIGHTDRRAVHPGGGYASNAELGMLRATVVREVLSSSARMPTARISLSSLAGVLPPHPGGNASGDPRNRTVSLRISAAGGR